MPSSKLPVEFVLVPQAVIELAGERRGVFCNLRPEQRPDSESFEAEGLEGWQKGSDVWYVHKPTRDALKRIEPGTQVVLLFQGYGDEDIGTAVVQVDQVNWFHGYPRLDFARPEGFGAIHGSPNFWGAFILAIAIVSPRSGVELFAVKDKGAQRFLTVVRESGV